MSDSINHFTKVLEKSRSILYCTFDKDLHIISYNDKFRSVFSIQNNTSVNHIYLLDQLLERSENKILLQNINLHINGLETPEQFVFLSNDTSTYHIELNKIEDTNENQDNWLLIGHKDNTGNTEHNSNIQELPFNEELFDLAGDCIFVGDNQAQIVMVNKKACEITGFKHEHFINNHISIVFDQEDLKSKPLMFNKVIKGEDVRNERLINRNGKAPLLVEMVSNKTKHGYITIMRNIQERKQLEQQLKSNLAELTQERQKVISSEKRFRDYLEQNSAAMLAIDPLTKKINFANYAAAKLYNYSRLELMEMKTNDLNHFENKEINNNFEKDSFIESEEYHVIHKRKDGQLIDVLINESYIISNQQPSLLQIIHDISEDIKNKEKLVESHNTYRNILNSISEMIYILDENGKFLFINDAAIKTYGYEMNYFLDKTPAFLSAPGMNDLNLVMERVMKAYNGTQNTIDFWGLRKDQSIFPKEVVLSPGYFFTKKVVIAVSRDISEHFRITKELTDAKNKAEENDKLKSAFLANMSHEIRTPMNAILGFSELIKDPEIENDERDKFLEIINKSSYHLLNLINDIVDISKIHANQLKINRHQCYLNALLHEKYISFKNELDLLQNKNINLELIFGLNNGEDKITTDVTRLEQVLNNIIGNSIKFTKEGSIVISYQLVDSEIVFSVTDTGIGIEEQQKEIIFERFMQADPSISREFGGTGLGLAISKACIELLGGEIWLESKLGEGTKMSFSIPHITEKSI